MPKRTRDGTVIKRLGLFRRTVVNGPRALGMWTMRTAIDEAEALTGVLSCVIYNLPAEVISHIRLMLPRVWPRIKWNRSVYLGNRVNRHWSGTEAMRQREVRFEALRQRDEAEARQGWEEFTQRQQAKNEQNERIVLQQFISLFS